MKRVDIQVPFEENDQVKALGARWDPEARTWFVPKGLDPGPFLRWIPPDLVDELDLGSNTPESAPAQVDTKRVYLISGRNIFAHRELSKFLTAAGLKPTPWPGAAKLFDLPEPFSPRLIKIAFSGPTPIVILLSGDEQAKPVEDLVSADQQKRSRYAFSWSLQPYADTIFLAGLAIGARPAKTVLVLMGKVRKDVSFLTRDAVRMDNSMRARRELIARLREVGCAVDVEGDWSDAGDFETFMKSVPTG